MKTIGLTYDLKTDYEFKKDDPPDADAEFDHPSTVGIIAQTIAKVGFKVKKIGNVFNLLGKLNNLGVDMVFNISEGDFGRNRESQVPLLLEMRGIPFVGSDALTLGLTLDKIMAKKIFKAEGILTPRFFEIKSVDNLKDVDHLDFPLIVKPRFEGSSKGLSQDSRVETLDALKEQAELIITRYKQPVLVEEFISGREFTVVVVGNDPPEALPAVQIKIDGKFKLNEKFYTFSHITSTSLEYVCPGRIESSLAKRISELAVRVYTAVECRDFGRVDFRVDKEGEIYALEINPLPSLSTDDVFPFAAKAIGISYSDLIGRIISAAFQRYGRPVNN